MKKSLLFLAVIVLGATSQSLLAGGPPELPSPDGGTTAALLTAGIGGLVWARRHFRR